VRNGIAIGVLCCVVTCAPEPPADLPPIAKPDFTIVDWPWCGVQVPPLMDCGEWGSITDVGNYVKEEAVCRLAEEMKRCLNPEHWERIEGIKVCRTTSPIPRVYIVIVLPDLLGSVWVLYDEETGEVTCG